MQTDPIGYEDNINLYAYVGNDPVGHVDPTGMDSECVDNGDGTQTCTYVVTASAPVLLIIDVGAGLWNGFYRGYRKVRDTLFNNENTSNENEDKRKPYASETPDDKPENYEPTGKKGRKSSPKKNKEDGSYWEKDQDGHGGSKWKRWPSKKDWEKNKGRQSVRPDGSIRERT